MTGFPEKPKRRTLHGRMYYPAIELDNWLEAKMKKLANELKRFDLKGLHCYCPAGRGHEKHCDYGDAVKKRNKIIKELLQIGDASEGIRPVNDAER